MTSAPAAVDAATDNDAGWSVAGVFLEALAHRDFDTMQACLDPSIRFRALCPLGPFELHGALETAARFRLWFDRHELFEMIDASIGQLGSMLYLRWRILRAGTADGNDSRQVVEQHVFASVLDRIVAIDLLCSGFNAEHPGPRCADRSCSPAGPGTDVGSNRTSVRPDSSPCVVVRVLQ